MIVVQDKSIHPIHLREGDVLNVNYTGDATFGKTVTVGSYSIEEEITITRIQIVKLENETNGRGLGAILWEK